MKPLHAFACACALVLLAGACATKKEPPPKPFTGTRWLFVLDRPPPEPLWVQFADGQVLGFAGCNRFNARFVQDTVGARYIAVGVISKVPRVCEASLVQVENQVLGVLQSVSSYSITGDELTMTGSAGTLRFRAAP